jgi:signal recognition particle receptor subunit beta
MALINYAKREINAKIVYYGPGLCGKTTNIKYVHEKLRPDTRGKLLSLATETDRTLFFDFLPVDLGEVKGYQTRFHLYTVPGQVFYNSTRKMVLKGADGIVFVADSQREMLQANQESLANLRETLAEQGKNIDDIPMVIQYNKRDLPSAMTVEELDRALNPRRLPTFSACAHDGTGVLSTLSSVAKMILFKIRESVLSTPDNQAEKELGTTYRAARKEEDRFTAPEGPEEPVPVAPPPPPRFILDAIPGGTIIEPSRAILPVQVKLSGVAVTFEIQLRVGIDASGAPRAMVERVTRKD